MASQPPVPADPGSAPVDVPVTSPVDPTPGTPSDPVVPNPSDVPTTSAAAAI